MTSNLPKSTKQQQKQINSIQKPSQNIPQNPSNKTNEEQPISRPPMQKPQIKKQSAQKLSDRSALQFIRQSINGTTQLLRGIGPWIHRKKQLIRNNSVVETWRDDIKEVRNNVTEPIGKLYQSIPQTISDVKFQLISPFSYHHRFILLNVLCAFTAIGTYKYSVSPLSVKLLKMVKNVGMLYVVGGLVFAPEMYNPLITRMKLK